MINLTADSYVEHLLLDIRDMTGHELVHKQGSKVWRAAGIGGSYMQGPVFEIEVSPGHHISVRGALTMNTAGRIEVRRYGMTRDQSYSAFMASFTLSQHHSISAIACYVTALIADLEQDEPA